jgi:O-antigen/teichoic acid export membrane protein
MSQGGKGLFKNIASLGIVQIANYVLPLISIPVISRILGPDKLGVINYAVAFIAYFNVFIGFGFDLTATRRLSKEPNNLSLRIVIFNEVFFSQLLLFCISVVLFATCLFYVPPLAHDKLVAVFTFFICISTLFAQNWLFQAMHDLPKLAWMNFFFKLLFTIAILFFIKKKEDYILQPLLTGLMQIIVSVLCFAWAFRRYHLKFQRVSIKRILAVIAAEKTIFFSLIAINLYTTTNTVMLGLMEKPVQVGYYSAAQRLMSVVTGIINMPLSQAFYPFIGLAFSNGIDNGIATVQKILPIIVLFTLATSVSIFFLGPTVIHWFYGDKFTASIGALKIIAFIPLVGALSNMFGMQIMLNLKLDKLYFRISAVGSVLGLVLNYLMISRLGFIGTAWNWIIVEIYITVSMYIVLRYKGINPVDLKQFSFGSILGLAKNLSKKKSNNNNGKSL